MNSGGNGAIIEVQGLTKYYGLLAAVRDISFAVKKGEILGLLGPNGAGKTTTMRLLTCYIAPSSGTATLAGYDIMKNSLEIRRRIGYMPENPPIYDEMTVRGYLKYVADIKEVPRREKRVAINRAIELVRLEEVHERIIGNLSRGFRQRVGLAQALIHNPDVLILDEPTIGLDPKQIIEIRNLIKALSVEHTIILSSHILPEVSATCDRVVILNQGEVAAIDTQEELARRVSGSGGLRAEVKGPIVEIENAIRTIKGVLSIDSTPLSDDLSRFEIDLAEDADIREELFRLLARRNWPIMELRRTGVSLEEVFLKLTTEETGARQ
jgi:gliding motility-associated transport system ATP-binding protein